MSAPDDAVIDSLCDTFINSMGVEGLKRPPSQDGKAVRKILNGAMRAALAAAEGRGYVMVRLPQLVSVLQLRFSMEGMSEEKALVAAREAANRMSS